MKTIIATIKPPYLGFIRRGKKAIELRKTCPAETPFRVLCCKSGSGGVIEAEFIVRNPFHGYPEEHAELIEKACVSLQYANEYAGGKELWFWDINDMIDYCSTKGQRVRNISEFGLKRAPQSWQYVEVDD